MKYIIVDPDKQNSVELIKLMDDYETLSFQGSFNTCEEAENNIRVEPPDVAFIRMGKAEINAFKLIGIIRGLNLFSKVIFISNQEEYAVESFEYEADGFLLIPFDEEKIRLMLIRCMESDKLEKEY